MMQSILTVTTAASTYDLTSLANVKAELGIANGTNETVLKRYISGASSAVAQYCNRVFVSETLSENFIPSRRDRFVRGGVEPLQLARFPVTAITSVTEDGTTLTMDDYLADNTFGQLTRINDDGFPRNWLNAPIVVEYSAGFATIPSDVEDAVIRMVTARYLAKGRDRSLKQESIPGVIERQWWIATGIEAGNMTPDIADILDNYRLPVAA
jgi:hypothetical protein